LPQQAHIRIAPGRRIKAESVWAGPVLRPAALLAERAASGAVRIRSASGDQDWLIHDGADLAAALQTIREIGDDQAIGDAIDHAFPGSSIQILGAGGRFELTLRQPGLQRPLRRHRYQPGAQRSP
jgi:predicted ATPase